MAVQANKRDVHPSGFSPFRFLRETVDELRKVVWPSGPELYRYTMVVLVTVVVLAVFIGLVDLGANSAVARLIVGH
ncbi:MAG: preprotein translocase subunit SecE [Candidatus Dormibacteraceae bacterium]